MSTGGWVVEATLGPGPTGPPEALAGIVTGLVLYSRPGTGPTTMGLVLQDLNKKINMFYYGRLNYSISTLYSILYCKFHNI